MYDLHSHILPGIDDGPDSIDKAIEMARIAVSDGITHMVATPHIHPGRYDNQITTIKPGLQALQKELKKQGIPLRISMGAEVRISTEILTLIPAGKVPFIGRWDNQDVLLLELPHSHILPGTDKLISWLKQHNIIPVIAHPERNKEIMACPAKAGRFIEAGCLIQLTAMSVAGGFGQPAKACADYILQHGWATLLATDTHNIKHRPPILSHGLSAAAKIVGSSAAKKLVIDNPARIMGRVAND